MRLHPELGVNPRLIECTVCGREVNGIALLGLANHKATCLDCGVLIYGQRGHKCAACGGTNFGPRVQLAEREKILGVCDACEREREKLKTEVQMGGIYVQCAECGMHGVVKHDNPLCVDVRKACGPEYMESTVCGIYKACGLEFLCCSEHEGE